MKAVETTVLLVRHGHVEGIVPKRFRGRAPLALTPRGRAEAEALAARLAHQPVAAVYSSPMDRARMTAAAIAARHGLDVIVEAAFNDIDYGAWQGATLAEIALQWPDEMRTWLEAPHLAMPPGGESLGDVSARATRALTELVRTEAQRTFVVVGHESVNRLLLLHALGMPLEAYWRLEQAPCALNVLRYDSAGHRFTVVAVNEGWQENDGRRADVGPSG